jgi:phage/plasmid-associated DNA primase
MKVIAYLNSKNCKWFPINLVIEDNKKILKPYNEDLSMPTMNDFDKPELIELRKNWSYETIAIDTNFIQQLDIDTLEAFEKVKPILSDQPYFLSKTKNFPHIFINLEPKKDHGKRSIFTELDNHIDILNGQWSYCDSNTDVINAESPIQTMNLPRPEVFNEHSDLTIKYSSQTIQTLLEIINPNYIEKYDSWFRIAVAVFNCGCDFEIFDTWSKKSKNYGGTKKLWKQISKGHLTDISIGTLCYYAKESNVYLFNLIKDKLPNKNQIELIDRFLDQISIPSITNSLVGDIFYEKFKDKFTYSNRTWYRLNEGGIYEELGSDADTILCKQIKKYFQSFILRVIENTEDENKKKKLWKAHTSIESASFQKQSMETAKQQFLNEKLNDELNKNGFLVGFTNGVYDLNNNIFRKGTILDKVSMTTGYNYTENYNYTESSDYKFFDELIDSLFENKLMSNYFKKHLGSFLEASNKEEKIYFWTGKGRNGKGTVDTLLRSSLGVYYTLLDNGYYTNMKKQNSIAEPELIKLDKKRCVMTTEPAESTKYITSKTKKISGNDPIEARDLYSKANEIKTIESNFKCVIQTQYLPQFDEVDLGLLSRIEVVDFPFSFLEPDKIDINNIKHKQVNINLKTELKSKNNTFFNYLLHWYYIYKKEGISLKPKEVLLAVKEYSSKIDTIKTFIVDCLIKTDDVKDKVSVSDLLTVYNESALERMYINIFSSKITKYIPTVRKTIGSLKMSVIEGYKIHPDYIGTNDFNFND